MKIESMLCRKIIAAAVTSFILSFLLAIDYVRGLNLNMFGWWMVYLMYAGPVIIIYGTITSFISEMIAAFIARKTSTKLQLFFSFLFHILFGLILWWISLIAAVIFFVLDAVLTKCKSNYSIKHAAIGLAVSVGCWLWMVLMINATG